MLAVKGIANQLVYPFPNGRSLHRMPREFQPNLIFCFLLNRD